MTDLSNSYAILIGVGNDDILESASDAKAIYKILSNPEFVGYRKENIKLITKKKAVRTNILKAFDSLIANTNEESTVLIYYSGHGGTYTDNDLIKSSNAGLALKSEEENETNFFLQLYDVTSENYKDTWLKAEELKGKISQIKSNRIIVLMDCCHAAGISNADTEINITTLQSQLKNPEGLAQKMDDGKGMSILTSCRAEEKSWSLAGQPLSLFTTCLLEVLKGEHKTFFEEPYIRLTEVINYIMREVPKRKPIQHPFVNIQMYDDFVLSKLSNEKIKQIKKHKTTIKKVKKVKDKEIVTNFREQKTANNAVLFVHGFSGIAHKTFDKINQLMLKDTEMEGWNMFPFGYSENIKPTMGNDIWASIEDIERVSDNLLTAIKYKYDKYNRLAIVAHSLGGLAVQKALLELEKKDLDRVSHVILFGSPNNGIDNLPHKLKDERWVDLEKEGFFIKKLRSDWQNKFSDNYPFKFKVVAGTQDRDVSITSNFDPFNQKYRATVAGHHFSMVTPETSLNDGYQLIIDVLNENEFYNLYTDQEEINNLLGEHEAVVKKLLPTVNDLSLKGLKELLYALEGLDKNDEVIEILNNHKLSQENTELLGFLAGRFKRKYLQNFLDEDAVKAVNYYTKALNIAQQKENQEQIYYHAINLAFLNLVYKEDKNSMIDFANQAIAATEKDPFNNLWKNATIAEASIYLGDFKKAKKYYTLAAKVAEIRHKIFIHTNAYHAYISLMGTSDDDFTKFLKDNFLS